MRSRGYARSRYRGSRRPSPLLWLLLAAAAAAALFLAFRFSRAQRPPEPPGDDVPALAPAGSGLSASGGDSSAPDASGQPAPSLPALPAHVRGIYITGPMAGSAGMEALTALVEETELNAVVIDVKNDVGNLTYLPDGGTARELGPACATSPTCPGWWPP